MYLILTFLCAVGFSLTHYFSKYITAAGKVPRNHFLSLTAGVAIAYVFGHLLPNMSKYQGIVSEELEHSVLGYIENHIYLIAMLGFVLFYALERYVRLAYAKTDASHASNNENKNIFWLHMVVFFLYNAAIGSLLINEHFSSPISLLFYFVALAVHFIAMDWGLRRTHKHLYDKYGHVLLSLAPLIGWVAASIYEISLFGVSVLQAFVAGAIILNVMKEELPEEQKSSISSFLLGVGGYTILLLLIA